MQPIKIIDDLYLPILAGLHIYPDESGVLHRVHRESNKICEVNKHKLCLPTDANLKSLSQQEYMFYHPMSENIARGDSVIYNYTKLALTLRINYTIIGLASILLAIANDKTLDGKLKSHQLEILAALPKVDKKTVDHFNNVVGKTDLDSNVFFTVYNKRNGKVAGVTYNRAAVVRFPLLEQLKTPETSDFWSNIKGIRKADYANYLALFNYLLPDWDVENTYSGVSDSMEAPSFHALIDSFVKVMKRLNEVMDKFRDIADVDDIYSSEIPAIETAIGQLQKYANIISPLEGNMGECAANDAQVNQLQQKPIGIPPVGLSTAAESKFDNLNVAPSQPSNWQQTTIPPHATPVAPQTATTNPTAFIGFGPGTLQQRQQQQPQQQIIGYDQFGQPIYGYPVQQTNGFIGFPNQGGFGGQQQQQTQVQSNDPLAQWNTAVAGINQNPPQGYGNQQGFGQQGFGQYQNFNGGFGGQQQSFGAPRPAFRKQGEAPQTAPTTLPPTFGGQQQQQTFGQGTRPTFRTVT